MSPVRKISKTKRRYNIRLYFSLTISILIFLNDTTTLLKNPAVRLERTRNALADSAPARIGYRTHKGKGIKG
ncbi:MAG: hypothetical protein CL941_07080 [Desulfobacter sp.]|nr:hypothetical protein [Desulfobacter sp.]